MKGVAVFLVVATVGIVLAETLKRAPPKCPPFDPEQNVVLLPNPDDCSSFYICNEEDIAVIMPCDGPLWFNPVSGLCDYPEDIPDESLTCVKPGNFTIEIR